MNDPKRLLEEGPNGALAELLSAGKSELPNDAQLASLAAKLGVAGGLGGAGGAAAAGGSTAPAAKAGAALGAAKAGLAVKVVGVIVAVSAIGGGVAVATRSPVSVPPPVGIVATAAPSAPASSEPTAKIERSADLPPEAWDPLPQASAFASFKPKEIAPPAEAAETEVHLLERAHDALASRPAEALEITKEHAKRFPNGMLAQEREVVAIDALVRMGARPAAEERAARFKARYPGSSHLRRIDKLIGD